MTGLNFFQDMQKLKSKLTPKKVIRISCGSEAVFYFSKFHINAT